MLGCVLGLGIDCSDRAGYSWPLVALASVLLTKHLFAHPEMATHLQIKATISAGIAGGVAVAVLLDPHGLVSVKDNKR